MRAQTVALFVAAVAVLVCTPAAASIRKLHRARSSLHARADSAVATAVAANAEVDIGSQFEFGAEIKDDGDNFAVGAALARGGFGSVSSGTQVRIRRWWGSYKTINRPVIIKDIIDNDDVSQPVNAGTHAENEREYASQVALHGACGAYIPEPLGKWYRDVDNHGTTESHMFIAMEKLEKSVKNWYQFPRTPPRAAGMLDRMKRVMRPMVAALKCIHNAGYVHRDLKAANFMLMADAITPKVIDFGTAFTTTMCNDAKLAKKALHGTVAYDPDAGFTPVWALASHSYTCAQRKKADFYALGLTLLEMYYGQDIFNLFTNHAAVRAALVSQGAFDLAITAASTTHGVAVPALSFRQMIFSMMNEATAVSALVFTALD